MTKTSRDRSSAESSVRIVVVPCVAFRYYAIDVGAGEPTSSVIGRVLSGEGHLVTWTPHEEWKLPTNVVGESTFEVLDAAESAEYLASINVTLTSR